MVVFLNGKFVSEAKALVPVSDRSFMYGDGLFETMRVHHGKPFRMAQHLERMVRGANFLKINLPFTPKELQALAVELIDVQSQAGPGSLGVSDAVIAQSLRQTYAQELAQSWYDYSAVVQRTGFTDLTGRAPAAAAN